MKREHTKTIYIAAGCLLLLIATKVVRAQVPQRISYQAVARDASGNVLSNQSIGVRLSVLDGGSGGPSVYTETHQVTTSALGLFTLAIGGGTTVSGTFSAIDWSTGSKYLRVEVDPTGGSSYTDLGSSELLSVPYALYSASSGGGGWLLSGNGGTVDGTHFIGTTDNVPLNIRVNNEQAGRIEAGTGANTFYGHLAGNSNAGSSNTGIGKWALYSNTTGYDNTASGYGALYSNTEGNSNAALGVNTLVFNTTGNSNTAIGRAALYYNTTGSYNTAIGRYALYENTTQNNNTAVGYSAGDFYDFTNGTFLGCEAYPNVDGYTNVMGLGYQARPTAGNQVRIGNSSVTAIGGFANWSNVSDGRFKKNVREDVKGLEFIMKLRPVTYHLAVHDLAAYLKEDQKRDEDGNVVMETSELDRQARDAKEKIRYTGFIAQEVEEAARAAGFDFSGVDAPDNENDLYGLRYAEFVVPLVKAVQELSSENAQLKIKLEKLQKQMDALNAHLGQATK